MPVPNVLLITLDDCGLDQINCYGVPGGLGTTTNIDALATAGLRFNWHYGHTNCAPGRSTVLLGRNPSRTGIGTVPQPPAVIGGYAACATQFEPANTEVFLATRLVAAGYATSHVGKWHLHCPSSSTDYDEVRTKGGYQDYRGWPWNLNPVYTHATSETRQSYVYNGLPIGAGGAAGAFGHPRIVNNAINNGGAAAPGSLTNAGGGPTDYCSTYITTREIDDAIARVGAMASPWFLSVSLHSPHVPMQAPPAALYTAGIPQIVYPVGHTSAGLAVGTGQYQAELYASYPATQAAKTYSRAIMYATDAEIGRLIAALPNNTLIIFTSDNGSGHTPGSDTTSIEGSWDYNKVKNTMYDGALRLPLIVSQKAGTNIISPGLVGTANTTDLIATADIFATIIQAAGGTMPTVANDSTSFYGTLSGTAHTRTEVISQAFAPNCDPAAFPSNAFTQRWYAIRAKSGYKVIRQVTDTPKVEFYKVADSSGAVVDQYEATNLLASSLSRLDNFYFKSLNAQLDSYITEVENLPTG